jgi:hypothetical protein
MTHLPPRLPPPSPDRRLPYAALATVVALIVLLALAGCTYTRAEYGDASLVSFRLWTDTSASLVTPSVQATYSSDADTAAAASQVDRLIGIIERQALPEQLRAF